LNIMATVFPDNDPWRLRGIEPVLISRLCRDALRTKVVNSAGVRSAMERRWRGAKGEVGGVVVDEYSRRSGLLLARRVPVSFVAFRHPERMVTLRLPAMVILLQNPISAASQKIIKMIEDKIRSYGESMEKPLHRKLQQ